MAGGSNVWPRLLLSCTKPRRLTMWTAWLRFINTQWTSRKLSTDPRSIPPTHYGE